MRTFAIISTVVYLLVRSLRGSGVLPDLLAFYAGDFLCLPVVLSLSILFLHKWFGKPALKLGLEHIVVAFISFSIVFEWVLPRQNAQYIADAWDVVAYGLGATLFWIVQKKAIPSAVIAHPGWRKREVE